MLLTLLSLFLFCSSAFYATIVLLGSSSPVRTNSKHKIPQVNLLDQDSNDIEYPYIVVIPAKNEAGIIGETLSRLLSEVCQKGEVFVIADNCDDETAEIARSYPVHVLERRDTLNTGKGFALQYAFDKLDLDEVKTVVLMDADSVFDKSSLRKLVRESQSFEGVIQCAYLMKESRVNEPSSVRQFMWEVKNVLRPEGLSALGLPCQLYGCGIAMPSKVVNAFNFGSSNIVEDREMSIRLLSSDIYIKFSNECIVESRFPLTNKSHELQNSRWLIGHLKSSVQNFKEIFNLSLILRAPRNYFSLLDCLLPPISVWLVLIDIVATFSFFLGAKTSLFFTSLAALMIFCSISFAALKREGFNFFLILLRKTPYYFLSKISTLKGISMSGNKSWNKTPRD